MGSYKDYQEVKPTSVAVESDDLNKWEMEIKPHIEEVYHLLLGEAEVNGEWKRVSSLDRVMNELGASNFVRELQRFNINEQFSELTEKVIDEMAGEVGINFSNLLEDNWKEWEVKPNQSVMKSICDLLVDKLRILLRIIKDGGMKTHRENRGVRRVFSPQQGEAEF